MIKGQLPLELLVAGIQALVATAIKVDSDAAAVAAGKLYDALVGER